MRSVLAVLLLIATPAGAEPALGTWLTGPDRKAQVAHVEVRRCGPALCGRIARAFGSDGAPVMTPNVGRELFWDMRAEGGGRYSGGRVFVPAHGREYDARMQILPDGRLRVQGCLGPVCDGQVWTRVN